MVPRPKRLGRDRYNVSMGFYNLFWFEESKFGDVLFLSVFMVGPKYRKVRYGRYFLKILFILDFIIYLYSSTRVTCRLYWVYGLSEIFYFSYTNWSSAK